MNENLDNLSLEEQIKIINEAAEKLAAAVKPVIEHLIKAFMDLGRAVNLATGAISAEDFRRMYMSETKKERHRRKYNRMMARRKNKNV